MYSNDDDDDADGDDMRDKCAVIAAALRTYDRVDGVVLMKTRRVIFGSEMMVWCMRLGQLRRREAETTRTGKNEK
jgi:hypothetical protein